MLFEDGSKSGHRVQTTECYALVCSVRLRSKFSFISVLKGAPRCKGERFMSVRSSVLGCLKYHLSVKCLLSKH
jgi:hypothetical protein